METRANHVLIGVFTLIGALVLVFGALWSSRWASNSQWQQLEVHFLQPVSGLSAGSEVEYNGIKMGTVRDLRLSPSDPGRVIAIMDLDVQAPLREDTTARLAVNGLTGVSSIQLRGGSPDSPVLKPVSGKSRAIIIAEESGLQRLIDKSEDIASTASDVMLRLLEFMSEENAEQFSATLEGISAVAETLSGERGRIVQIVENLHAGSEELTPLLKDLRSVTVEFSQALESLEPALAEDFPKAANQLQSAMSQLAQTVERVDRIVASNEEAAAGFGQSVITPLGPTVTELRQLLKRFSGLISRIERDPAGFLFGGHQPEEYKP